ncbi:MAG: peptidase domain-containing ABC transporter [Corynebacterium sp.]|uniref:peptidase domain-containing ABC transporter n=1 Tax=Corynebacterium sp. TaxID=1720 RepID=UPI0026DB04B5|nr:peptidase domain-containing ABC transporter [Corynebacterium sp.]MDO5099780.1 peptidase domain-containing ABC transporter [Corynebacterium sp.]
MLLQSYGCRKSLRHLRTKFVPGRDGLSVKQLIYILQQSGLATKAFRCSFSCLSKLSLPAIVAWSPNHYVLLTRVENHRCRVIDPASGYRWVSNEEFKKHFAELCLCPVGEARDFIGDEQQDENSWRSVLALLRGTYKTFLPLFLGALLVGLVTLYVPDLTSKILSLYKVGAYNWAWVALFGVIIGFFLVQAMNVVVTSFSASRIGRVLSEKIYHSLLNSPITYFLVRSQGELLYRMSLVKNLENFATVWFPKLLVAFAMAAVSLVWLITSSPIIFTMLIIAALSYFLIFEYIRVKTNRLSEAINEYESLANAQLVDSITSIDVVKSSGLEKITFEQWRKNNERVFLLDRKRSILNGIVTSFVMSLQSFMPIAVFLVAYSQSTFGNNIAFALKTQLLSTIFISQLTVFVDFGSRLGETNAAVRRIEDIIVKTEDPIFAPDAKCKFNFPVSVEKASLSFGTFSRLALKDISTSIEQGEHLAIVGETGCGKSSLARLFGGLLNPTSGVVRVQGLSIKEIDQSDFYHNVAYVPQDASLRNATLRDNLTWDRSIPDEELLTALRRAQFDFSGEEFPQGLDTFLTNGGQNISGGQRQRIAIARCFLSAPKLLILDEATSALDQRTEAKLYDVLRHMGCAFITVTHRLEVIQDFDRILVMKDGSIIESGSFEYLMNRRGEFYNIFNAYRQ